MRVYGELKRSLGDIISTPEAKQIYVGSFWDRELKVTVNQDSFLDDEKQLLQEIKELPSNSITRKTNEFIKRIQKVKINAYIINYLREEVAKVFWRADREKRQREVSASNL